MEKALVLIVDDSELITTRMRLLLEEILHELIIETAPSYTVGLLKLGQMRPKVVILDINLPDRSGLDLLQYIKRNQPEVRVIISTNQPSAHYKKLCIEGGAEYFIDKSNEFDLIPGLVAFLTSNYQATV